MDLSIPCRSDAPYQARMASWSADGVESAVVDRSGKAMNKRAGWSLGIGMALGAALGVGFGAAMHDLGAGLAVGLGLGAVLGAFKLSQKKRR